MVPTANPFKDTVNRRRMLQGLGALGAASIAGCLGDDGGDGDGGIDPVQDRVTVDPGDIVEGGTFRTAIAEPIDSFDVPMSTSASVSNVHGLLYEGMITTDATGELYPWLAESYERIDLQSVGLTDYEDYMVSAEYDDEGVPQLDRQIVFAHPDNDPSSGEGQFVTVEEAPEAIDDGTYGMHFRFDLHEGIEFHDGEELTADNVVASYERLRGSLNSGQLYDSLLDIQADGDYTVHLYCQQPDAQAIRNLGGWEVYPTAVTDLSLGDNDPRQGNTPLGCGPFTFEEYEQEQYVVLTRNEDYWFDKEMKDWYDGDDEFPDGPVVDGVDISIIPDPSTRAGALQSDEIDMAYGLTTSTLSEYDESEDYRAAATDGAGYTFLQHPVTVEPFTDARVRRAINQLIPRESIADEIFSGWENPAWVPLPPLAGGPGTTDYDQLVEDLRSYNEYDREAANSLVEEAVDENGWETPIEVTIETNSNNDDRIATVETIVESLNQSEYFEANVETYPDLATALLTYYSDDYADRGVFTFVGLSSGFGPHGYASSIHHPDYYQQCCNLQNVDIEELNQALDEARYTSESVEDDQTRRERYDEIWELILEYNANSYGTHSTTVGVVRQDEIFGFNTYPSTQSVVPYAVFNPIDEQIVYVDR